MKTTSEKANIHEWLATLEEAGSGKHYPALFKRVRKILSIPSRKRSVVTLHKINKYTKEGDNVIIPRKVLTGGKIEHKVTIAALEYSARASAELKQAGCKIVPIKEIVSQKKITVLV